MGSSPAPAAGVGLQALCPSPFFQHFSKRAVCAWGAHQQAMGWPLRTRVPLHLPVLCPRAAAPSPPVGAGHPAGTPRSPHACGAAWCPGARGWRMAACDSVTISMATVCGSASAAALWGWRRWLAPRCRQGDPRRCVHPDRGCAGPPTCPSPSARGHGSIPTCPAPVSQMDAASPRLSVPPWNRATAHRSPTPCSPTHATPAPMGVCTFWGLLAGWGGGREGW